jgi:hypothetical protein
MKKALLFTILALSINAFAQSKRPASNMQHTASKSFENVQGRLEEGGWKTSGIYIEMKSGPAFKHQIPNQRDLIQILDSMYMWTWDTLYIQWKNNFKYIDIIYNLKNNLTSYTRQSLNGSAWENVSKYTFTYDANNNNTSELQQSWDGSAWVNYLQYIFTYDANNNNTSWLWQIWGGSAWVNYRQYTYTYDANYNETNVLSQNWDGSAWVNYYQLIYTYESNNNLTSSLQQVWDSGAWWNLFKGTYLYDANNNLTSYFQQTWYGSDWVNKVQEIHSYDANNNKTSVLSQNWVYGAWVNSFQGTYLYDANNNLTSYLQQTWYGSDWVNWFQDIYTYDANNFTKSETWKYWNITGTKIERGDSIYCYFHTIIGLNDLMIQEGHITVYPNPNHGQFTISSNSNISSIEIYNLLGVPIYSDFTNNRQTSKEIDLSNSPRGIYFIKIYDGTNNHCGKIILK